MKKLTDLQWAILLTVKQEGTYHFVGNERKAAERLVNAGLLEPGGPDHRDEYVMTELGKWTFDEQTEAQVSVTYIQKT